MKKLEQLIVEYKNLIASIHENRKEVKARLEVNRQERKKLNAIKKEIIMFLAKEQDKGKSLYRICIDQFGRIDGRFHILLSLFDKA